MARIKKTASNPPALLKKAIMDGSKSTDWDSARNEWVMTDYYNSKNQCKFCPCSVTQIENITIIENLHTGKRLEICQSCAKIFFNITDSEVLESDRRALLRNSGHLLDDISLQYMCHKVAISRVTRALYALYTDFRADFPYNAYGFTGQLHDVIRSTNDRFLELTDHENRRYFEIFDYLTVEELVSNYLGDRCLGLGELHSMREELLSHGCSDKTKHFFRNFKYLGSHSCRLISFARKSTPTFNKLHYMLFIKFQYGRLNFDCMEYLYFLRTGFDRPRCYSDEEYDFLESYTKLRQALSDSRPNDGIRFGPYIWQYWIAQMLCPTELGWDLERIEVLDRKGMTKTRFDWSIIDRIPPIPDEARIYNDATIEEIRKRPFDFSYYDQWQDDFSEYKNLYYY